MFQMSLLSNEDLLHLSSYLITGCLLLLVAFVCAAVAIVLFILILVAIVWQRQRDPTDWIGRKRLNPDALWIHKR